MSGQAQLRRKIAALEDRQERRRAIIEQRRKDEDALLERAELELANLRAQLTIGVVQ